MNTGHSYEAVKELNSLIKKQPNLNGAYHARGAAYTRQGLEVIVYRLLMHEQFAIFYPQF